MAFTPRPGEPASASASNEPKQFRGVSTRSSRPPRAKPRTPTRGGPTRRSTLGMALTLLRPDRPNDAAPCSHLNGCHPRPVNGYMQTLLQLLNQFPNRHCQIFANDYERPKSELNGELVPFFDPAVAEAIVHTWEAIAEQLRKDAGETSEMCWCGAAPRRLGPTRFCERRPDRWKSPRQEKERSQPGTPK